MRTIQEQDFDTLEQLQNTPHGLTITELAEKTNRDPLSIQLSVQKLKKKGVVFIDHDTGTVQLTRKEFAIRQVKCPMCQTVKRVPNTQISTHCSNKDCRKASGELRQYWIVSQYSFKQGVIKPINIA